MLPDYLTRTQWVLAGESLTKMAERSRAQAASGIPDVGAMGYMLSKDGYLGDNVKPPLTIFVVPVPRWGDGTPDTTRLE